MRPLTRYPSLAERILAHSVSDPDGECWVWVGYRDSRGYGQMTVRKGGKPRKVWAHIAAYELLSGRARTPGMTLDHTCMNRSCINPAHLVEVTRSRNSQLRHTRRQDNGQ